MGRGAVKIRETNKGGGDMKERGYYHKNQVYQRLSNLYIDSWGYYDELTSIRSGFMNQQENCFLNRIKNMIMKMRQGKGGGRLTKYYPIGT